VEGGRALSSTSAATRWRSFAPHTGQEAFARPLCGFHAPTSTHAPHTGQIPDPRAAHAARAASNAASAVPASTSRAARGVEKGRDEGTRTGRERSREPARRGEGAPRRENPADARTTRASAEHASAATTREDAPRDDPREHRGDAMRSARRGVAAGGEETSTWAGFENLSRRSQSL